MRKIPPCEYGNMPCSYVAAGCAYFDMKYAKLNAPLPGVIGKDGYLTLESANNFFRKVLSIRKKQNFKKGHRPLLKDFLERNTERACVCVCGHYIYVNGHDYWSFLDNDNDEVVCAWYIMR